MEMKWSPFPSQGLMTHDFYLILGHGEETDGNLCLKGDIFKWMFYVIRQWKELETYLEDREVGSTVSLVF